MAWVAVMIRPRRQPSSADTGTPAISARVWDVVVVGGGNAGVTAAITARQWAHRVLLIERSPKELRGGNTRHTRDIRCAHGEDLDGAGAYPYDELWKDLCNVGSGPSNEKLAALTVAESESVPPWMNQQGVRWQQPLRGTLHLARSNQFFLGGGKALLNTYYHRAEELGIQILYGAKVTGLRIDGNRCRGLTVEVGQASREITASAVVCASGGFEANIPWLGRYWGDAAENFIIRGTACNDGSVLRCLYESGAAASGEERAFHAVAVDARSPRFDGGIATRLDMIPFGIVLNRHARRFYDEGEDFWPKRYAIWGRKIAEQEGQIAYAIWDSKVSRLFIPPMYPPARGGSIAEVAASLGIDPAMAGATVSAFNKSVVHGAAFDPALLDGCRTVALTPPKSNWAQPIDIPPFFGIAMRPGITFTYRGVAVDESARVQLQDGDRFENVFAAGEIMSGNVLSSGYLAGFGLVIGTVWGRIAGRMAAAVAGDSAQ